MTMETVPVLFLAASVLGGPAGNGSSAPTAPVLFASRAASPAAAPPSGASADDRDQDEQEDEYEEEDESVSLSALPPVVQDAIRRTARSSAIEELEKEVEAGVTAYEAQYRVDGVEHSVKVSVSGEVLEIEKEVAPASLPPEVRAAVQKRLPGGVIREAEAVYLGGEAWPTHYEVEVKSGRRTLELRVRSTGETTEEIR